jgi:3-oxoacyl-[acyl-carrier protein] reductase
MCCDGFHSDAARNRNRDKELIMTGRLANRVALIVGAARGIGAGIAQRFAEEGARVMIADTETEAGIATAAQLGGRFVATDISRKADAERAVAETLAAFGGLDIVVQNAGIYPWSLIENIEPEEWDAVLGVNLRGTYLIARAALPHMKAKKYGRMVFTSSITGPRVTSPGHGHYSASKAGINGFIKSAALEFSSYGITVNGVEPGNVMTEGVTLHRSPAFIRTMEESIPLGRLGSPRDVAHAVLFLASDEAAYITGTTIVIDGGQTLPEGKDFRLTPE